MVRNFFVASCLLLALTGASVSGGAGQSPTVPVPTLVGWAMMPADTFADGPTSGQFAGRGQFGRTLPLVDKQPVQGFSGVVAGPAAGTSLC